MTGLVVPDVTGLDIVRAGIAYAESGWYQAPVRHGTKNPGSVLGGNWQHSTSRDAQQIVAWLAGTSDGIALHVGRSGAVSMDVDHPENLPGILTQAIGDLRPPFQSSRPDQPGRGHYVFAQPAGRILGNSTGELGDGWGEIRGRNGVIIAQPTHHPDGGLYEWQITGPVPVLPDGLARLLPDASPGIDAATDAEVARFIAVHTSSTRPNALSGVITAYREKTGRGEGRHPTAVGCTVWAAKEARAGYYPAYIAFSALGQLFRQSLNGERPHSSEYAAIVAYAVGQAGLASLDQVRNIAERADTRNLQISVPQPAGRHAAPEPEPEEYEDIGQLTTIAGQYTAIDWAEAFDTQADQVEWLMEPLIERGTINVLYGAPGVGKSLITLEIAAMLAVTGITVLYIDHENRIADIVERLQDMGYKATELRQLRFYSFASLPALDTMLGGFHLRALAIVENADLIVIDTTMRMVDGKENDSDTINGLYRHSLVPLKALNMTVLRLDHPGKDASRGQRGSSAKQGDVDTIWRLSGSNGQYRLDREKTRNGHGENVVTLTRLIEPLRHAWSIGGTPVLSEDSVRALKVLDDENLPSAAGRDKAREVLLRHDIHLRNEQVSAIVRYRRNRPGQLGTAEGSATVPCPHTSVGTGDSTRPDPSTPFFCETCHRTHPLAEHASCMKAEP